MPVLACFMLTHSTHSVVLILMQFVSIKVFNADEGLVLVMESARLWYLWIHFILVISCCLYDWCKLIISTNSWFSCVVPNFTRQLYRDFESVHRISGTTDPKIFLKVAFMTALMSNSCAIPYSSLAKTLRITRLYFIKDKCMIFALLAALARQITWPICVEMSLLFANEESIKTTS